MASNTRRALSYFLEERRNALEFLVERESVTQLREPERLMELLAALKNSFGGFVDLGLIDGSGRQEAYVGPYELTGKDYSGQPWFENTLEKGAYTSQVFLGYRDEPPRHRGREDPGEVRKGRVRAPGHPWTPSGSTASWPPWIWPVTATPS